MNKLKTLIGSLTLGLLLTGATALRAEAQQDYQDYQDYDQGGYQDNNNYQDNGNSADMFYNDLAPHGRWINNNSYGQVWVPNAGRGFRPYYTNGHWAMTQYGNMWVSDYDWGWAPFHYGRWTYD